MAVDENMVGKAIKIKEIIVKISQRGMYTTKSGTKIGQKIMKIEAHRISMQRIMRINIIDVV